MKRKRLDLCVYDADENVVKPFSREGVSPEMALSVIPFLEPSWVMRLQVIEFDAAPVE